MDKNQLLNKPLSQEYKSKVLAAAKMELQKNKPARQPIWNWAWLSVPAVAIFAGLVITGVKMNDNAVLQNESVAIQGVASVDEMDTIQHIDILEEL